MRTTLCVLVRRKRPGQRRKGGEGVIRTKEYITQNQISLRMALFFLWYTYTRGRLEVCLIVWVVMSWRKKICSSFRFNS